ncbi:MAG: septum site-determining protein MinC [Chloroflexi bacterium]|nr:septum site-determining protein MinC [Chloroflexota bacterium]
MKEMRTEHEKKKAQLTIKGLRNGLLTIVPEDGPWTAWTSELERKVSVQPEFFRGGRIILEVGSRHLSADELGSMEDLLVKHGLRLIGVVADLPDTRLAASELGLRVMRTRPGKEPVHAPDTAGRHAVTGEPAVLVERTLRSGQWIQYEGHVIVLGDVNPGAKVVAGGNIIVWGKLRGVVHAGATGNEESVVCALDLAPTQLRIAGYFSRAPEAPSAGKVTPEIALVRDDQIIVQAWTDHG